MSLENRRTAARPLAAGVITGQIAGLIMAVVVMAVFTLFLGRGPLYPVQLIGSAVFGPGALEGFQPGALLAGLVLHQAGPSLFWGVAFGLAAGAIGLREPARAAALGVIVGVLSMVVDVYLAVPLVMKARAGADLWAQNVPILWDWAAHLVFGLSFVLYPAVETALARRAGAAGAAEPATAGQG
jgi:hypothetical protein